MIVIIVLIIVLIIVIGIIITFVVMKDKKKDTNEAEQKEADRKKKETENKYKEQPKETERALNIKTNAEERAEYVGAAISNNYPTESKDVEMGNLMIIKKPDEEPVKEPVVYQAEPIIPEVEVSVQAVQKKPEDVPVLIIPNKSAGLTRLQKAVATSIQN